MAPVPIGSKTLSPSFNSLTSEPKLLTVPTPSNPGIQGASFSFSIPLAVRLSAICIPTASTCTIASSEPGVSSSHSTSCSEFSGGP